MLDYKELIEEIHAELDKLEAGAATRLRSLIGMLTGRASAVEAEVKADAEQVAKDAESAAAPVVNEAVQDVAAVADHAVADASAPAEGLAKQ